MKYGTILLTLPYTQTKFMLQVSTTLASINLYEKTGKSLLKFINLLLTAHEAIPVAAFHNSNRFFALSYCFEQF